jgi:hypothetical protein
VCALWQKNCSLIFKEETLIAPEVVIAFLLSATPPQQAAPPATAGSSVSRTFTGIVTDTQNTSCGVEVAKAMPKGACPPRFGTTNFGLVLQDGKTVKFDEAGNARVIDALRRSKKGSNALFSYWRTGKATTAVRARAVGTLTGDTLNLEAIQVD